ncbi:hypothetical protein WQ54_21370 [Bacillus sp. SA1-12]|uniref:enoyl-CoA hydratase/isomerase family protein n=1 Tax=Bacillus sp. SA1-12 TaxID=1455638 RepID=UPI000627277B|nr:enoyl-CoA hydratase/isomerase family protein [Bacillus sp. SA1-12]KKI90497.1 hypothetical protein WQ54_21370 [Bacillus sp. SA1-12]
MDKVKLVIHQNETYKKVAQITLNSVQNLNAIDVDLYIELKKSLEIIKKRDDIGVLMITSELTRAFSTGVNVKYIQTLTNKEASHFFQDLSNLLSELALLPIPTIALVNGYTFGAGADLALACDLRIASLSAVFRFPGPQFGLILGTQRLINEVGPSAARYLTLTNTKVPAQKALTYGLIHEVCKDEKEGLENLAKWADTMLNIPLQTAQQLKQLCHTQQDFLPNLTKDSVLNGDFGKRFKHYLMK